MLPVWSNQTNIVTYIGYIPILELRRVVPSCKHLERFAIASRVKWDACLAYGADDDRGEINICINSSTHSKWISRLLVANACRKEKSTHTNQRRKENDTTTAHCSASARSTNIIFSFSTELTECRKPFTVQQIKTRRRAAFCLPLFFRAKQIHLSRLLSHMVRIFACLWCLLLV